MRVSATAKYIRRSTRKTRLVTAGHRRQARRGGRGHPAVHAAGRRQGRGQGAQERRRQRREQPRPVARRPRASCEAIADEGPTMKRFRPRAQGRAFPIHKPMTHVTIVVENREASAMGHKVHPNGFRLGVSRTWNAKWYSDKDYTDLLKEDMTIRTARQQAARQRERQPASRSSAASTTSRSPSTRPSRASSSARAAPTSRRCARRSASSPTRKVKLEIKEIRQPELDAVLVATNIAQQLTRRIAFRKAIKQSVQRTMKAGAKGVKVAGRRPPRRRRDGAPRVGQGRPHPARHAARRHQLRPGPRAHDLRRASASRSGSTAATCMPERHAPARAGRRPAGGA